MPSTVAVIIPTYKPAAYLKRCFDALEKQEMPKEEFCVYLCLNGPREPYEAHIRSLLRDVSFQWVFHYNETPGVSSARNCLIDLSSEPLVTFVDDDDAVSENYLSALADVTSKAYMGIAKIYNFEEEIHEKRPNHIGKSYDSIQDTDHNLTRARKYFSSPWGKMLHREMIGEIRFDTGLELGEDGLFMAQVSRNIAGVRKSHEHPEYYVFEREESLTRSNRSLWELLRIGCYLVGSYMRLALTKGYDTRFMATRVLATLSALKSQLMRQVQR